MKDCPTNKILNPKTNKCVSKTGIIGKKLLQKSNFSNFIKTTFNKYPLDHSIDTNAVKYFLMYSDISVRDICKKIIDNTDHISFENMIRRINMNVKDLLKFIGKSKTIYIYIGFHKNNIDIKQKSNYWLYIYIINYIKYISNDTIKIITISDFKNTGIRNNSNIILIDDCIYSGNQMSLTINKINFKKKVKLNIYLLVSYMSNNGLKLIKKNFNNNKSLKNSDLIIPKHIYIIKSINSILTVEEIKKLQIYYSSFINLKNKYLIYFDHKLADTVSTITPFYLGIVPCSNNYNISKWYYDKQFLIIPDNLINNYRIIPIIKNCSYYNNYLNFNNPQCPFSPYKQSFKEFINIIKNVKKHKSFTISNENKSFSHKSL